jgi:uncharacterized membrane protein
MKYLLEFESEREMDEWALSRVESIKRRRRTPAPQFDVSKLGPRQQEALDLFRDGAEHTTKEVVRLLNVPGPNASSVLRSLEERSIVRKVRRGVWQINPDLPAK